MQSDADARARLLDDSPRMAPSEYSADHGVPSAFLLLFGQKLGLAGILGTKAEFCRLAHSCISLNSSISSNRVEPFRGVVAPLLAEREIYLWWWPR